MKKISLIFTLAVVLVLSASCNRDDEQLEANTFVVFNYIKPDADDVKADKDFIIYTLDKEIAKGKNKVVYPGGYSIKDPEAAKAACESALKKMDNRNWTMSLGFALRDNNGISIWHGSVKASAGNTDPEEVGFIDLGLSVLWSDRNLDEWWTAADGWFYDCEYNSLVPSEQEWQELWEKCTHKVSSDGKGLIFTGNGNSIYIPCKDPFLETSCIEWYHDDYSGGPQSTYRYPLWAPDNTEESTVYATGFDNCDVVSFHGPDKMTVSSSLKGSHSDAGSHYCDFFEGIVRLIRKK